MAKIAYIILAHEGAEQIADLASTLTLGDADCQVVIHYDKNSSAKEYLALQQAVSGDDRIFFVADRVACGWGDFSLVESVLRALKLIAAKALAIDHVMHISGSCMPIRPLSDFSAFLDANPAKEFIETFGPDWIVGGLREERYEYHHIVNHRKYRSLFNQMFKMQRAIKVPRRKFPSGITPRFGSQWWTLTWKTCAAILALLEKRPELVRFFRTTWIPDEFFFQSMVAHLAEPGNIISRNLTFYKFNDWGMPLVFLNDHARILREMPYFFARKINPRANWLRADLRNIAISKDPAQPFDIMTGYEPPLREIARDNVPLKPGSTKLFYRLEPQDPIQGLSKNFIVLFGPYDLTRAAADAIRHQDGISVLGRIFDTHKVDFGPEWEEFDGLKTTDVAIRNAYPVTYLNMVLSRCAGLPVIELAPGDAPLLEAAFARSPSAIFLPVISRQTGSVWADFYWALCARYLAEPLQTGAVSAHASIHKAIGRLHVDPDLRAAINALLSGGPASPHSKLDAVTAEFRNRHLSRQTMEILPWISAALKALPVSVTLKVLPSEWQEAFSVLDSGQPAWTFNYGLELPPLPIEAPASAKQGRIAR